MINVELKNMKTLQRKLDQITADLHGDPMRGAMAEATMLVTRSARQNAPVDMGTLRASILPEVVMRTEVVTGIVGSALHYAPHMEFGTKPHWVPKRVLYEWALRKTKGKKKAAIALAHKAWISIGVKGLKARRYLQSAVEDNADRIFRILGDVVGRIVSK